LAGLHLPFVVFAHSSLREQSSSMLVPPPICGAPGSTHGRLECVRPLREKSYLPLGTKQPTPVHGTPHRPRSFRDVGAMERVRKAGYRAPLPSCRSAGVTYTAGRRPSVSTSMWRLRPFTHVCASNPQIPADSSTVLTRMPHP
jgi:hypothetical protein